MSMLVSLFKGYFEGDAEIMQNQREYDQEKLKIKEESLRQTEKENRAWVKELKKLGLKSIDTKYNNLNQGIIDGKLTLKEGINLEKAQASEKAGVLLGTPFSSDISNLVNVIDKTSEFNSVFGDLKFRNKANGNFNDASAYLAEVSALGETENYKQTLQNLKTTNKPMYLNFMSSIDRNIMTINNKYFESDPTGTTMFDVKYFPGINNILKHKIYKNFKLT